MNIVLVEDREEDVELSYAALSSNGFQGKLLWKRDGQEAIDFFFNDVDSLVPSEIALIILDMDMPKVNGLEVLKRLKKSEYAAIPVVMMTACALDDVRLDAYRNHVNSFVVKPTEFMQYKKFVTEISSYWLSNNRAV